VLQSQFSKQIANYSIFAIIVQVALFSYIDDQGSLRVEIPIRIGVKAL
jgi:hypothetical protein